MSDDLVKRLRDMPNYYNSGGRFVAADRIEELEAKALANRVAIMRLEAKLATQFELWLVNGIQTLYS